jgi:hypothetical protein
MDRLRSVLDAAVHGAEQVNNEDAVRAYEAVVR